MTHVKLPRLSAAVWTVGDATDFLDLPVEDGDYVELKTALATLLHERRRAAALTQATMARQVGTSQPRLVKMGHADATVSVDLLVRTLLSAGASRQDIARAIAS